MSNLVVVDSDALIALLLEKDVHHKKTQIISASLAKKGINVIYPVTVFAETITFLKRAVNQSEKAHALNERLQNGEFTIEYIENQTLRLATEYFSKTKSKRNTFFDAIVAATAKKLGADAIFSFDDWYPKLGFKLADKTFTIS